MALYSSRWQQFLDHLYRNRRKTTAHVASLTRRGLRLESLEERRLLSVSRVFLNPTNSKITFVGSEVADTAVVSESIPGVIDVSFEHDGQLTEASYAKSAVSSIVFYGEGGSDSFTNTTSLNVKAFGGLGNDTIVGGSGVDELFGDDGDDTLIGGVGDDSIKGGAGNDLIRGQAGDDYLAGDDGDDSLFGDSGNDSLYGHFGNDRLEGGDGNDTLYAGSGNDTLLGDAGEDVLFGEAGLDTLDGGSDNDQLRGGSEADNISGGLGDDYIVGEEGDDLLYGQEGNDTLLANSGNDYLEGGSGNDSLYGGVGDDWLVGNEGADILSGEAGNDFLAGGDENDELLGGEGADVIKGDAGDDYIVGDAGDDTLYGNDGNDTIYAFAGDDKLVGGWGDDKLYGAVGNDVLFGDEGEDALYGEEGNDVLYGGDDDDYLRGGEGHDNAYGDLGDDYLVGNEGNDNLYGFAGNDTLLGGSGDDRLVGNDGDDSLKGSTGQDKLYGNEGNDLLFGEEDADDLVGGEGNDTIRGGDGDDYLYGDEGDDYLVGEEGNDSLYGHAGADTLLGSGGDDRLVGNDGNDTIYGGDGNDKLYGLAGDDLLHGEAGNDGLIGGDGNDTLSGGSEHDFLYGNAGEDYLVGEDGNDRLYGHSGNDILHGGSGDDLLSGGSGDDNLNGNGDNDQIYGEDGADVLLGELGIDSLFGGTGNDQLRGGDGDDLLYGGLGDDSLVGEAGNDRLEGNDGNDDLHGHSGNDEIYGGSGNDKLFGNEGDDQLFGEEGDDRLAGLDGNDLLSGGQGEDDLNGNDGQDILIGGNQIDILHGAAGEDILIGTATTHTLDELKLLQLEWIKSNSFARRINDIQELTSIGLHLNGTVLDDHVVDQVYGGTESDWILLPGIHATFDPLGSSIPHDAPDHDDTTHSHSHSHGTVIDHLPAVEGFALIDSLDSLRDFSTEDALHTLIPHADDPSKRLEHLALFELVRYDQVTDYALESGDWSDPGLWSNGVVPQAGARVLIPIGVHVDVDEEMPQELATIRVDGTLSFSRLADTELRVDTVIVSGTGRFEMGTAASPIPATETARLVFTDNGAIDRDWDPFGISRGLITHGTVEIHGAETTAHVRTTGALVAGARTLTLQSVPIGWDVGDQIVIAGSSSDQEQSEQRTILAIVGNNVLIDALDYDHALPTTSGGVHVANVTRNVVLTSEGDAIARRGHTMFMHNRDVNVSYAQFDKLGRTDKLNPINDSVVDENWNLQAGTGTNNRARYAIHFHRNGTLANSAPSIVHGSVVTDNPGWGYVNHSSYVHFTENVAYDITGAAFNTEVGDEIGLFQGNIAIDIKGSGEAPDTRNHRQDFGHSGEGFWFQGAGISVIDNVAADAEGSAFFYYTRGFRIGAERAHFPAASLVDPSIAVGEDTILVDHVPVREFRGNIGYASDVGLSVRYHLRNAPHKAKSYLSDSQFWNNTTGVNLPYSNNVVLDNIEVRREIGEDFAGIGVDSNVITRSITYRDLSVTGYYRAIDVAPRGDSVIDGGFFQAIFAISVQSGTASGRTVTVQGNPVFATIPPEILGRRDTFNVHMRFDTAEILSGIQHLFVDNTVTLNYGVFRNQKVYYSQQDPQAIPFPTSLPQVPSEYVGLTSQQLFDQFGLIIGGEFAPASVTTVPGIAGLVGLPGDPEHTFRETRLDWRDINS